MQFTDGYWHLAPGVQASYAVRVERAWADGDGLTIMARTTADPSRAASLNQPILTLRLSSAGEGMIRVRLSHHEGGLAPQPTFELAECPCPTGVTIDDEYASLTSGGLTARVRLGAMWDLAFVGGDRTVLRASAKSSAYLTTEQGPFIAQRFELGVGELIYGLGERFGPLVKNGQTIDLWNADGGTSSEQAYKNVSFYLSNAGYGIFINQPDRVAVDIGAEAVSRSQIAVPGETLDFVVILGPRPKEVLERYTSLTGRPPAVPAWSLGVWLTTSFTTDYNEETILEFVDGMLDRGLPLSVFHFDCFWMRGFHWCDFLWDPDSFPDPAGLIAKLKQRGIRACVWINPYIAQASSLFAEGKKAGYLLKRPDGSVWQTDNWQAGMALVDFTNPQARGWYADKLSALMDMGVDCFKTDFGERVPTEVVWWDGSNPNRMHNYYTLIYNRCVFELLEGRRGKGEAVVFARSTAAGGQQYPVHWGGDSEATFQSMAETLRGGLSLASSGYGYWSHDIGGFEKQPDPELFIRWLQFGLFSSHARFHGSTSYRVPWAFGEKAVEVARDLMQWRMRLVPYLLGQAEATVSRGVPILRPMYLEFPEDKACQYLDRQYMLGGDLLVAPVFNAEGEASFYLPEGEWIGLMDEQSFEGGRWVTMAWPLESLPVLIRPGRAIPLGATNDRPEYDWPHDVDIRVGSFRPGEEHRFTVPSPTAVPVDFLVRRSDQGVEITSSSPAAFTGRVAGSTDPVALSHGLG